MSSSEAAVRLWWLRDHGWRSLLTSQNSARADTYNMPMGVFRMSLETGLCIAVLADLAARVAKPGNLALLKTWDGALPPCVALTSQRRCARASGVSSQTGGLSAGVPPPPLQRGSTWSPACRSSSRRTSRSRRSSPRLSGTCR